MFFVLEFATVYPLFQAEIGIWSDKYHVINHEIIIIAKVNKTPYSKLHNYALLY